MKKEQVLASKRMELEGRGRKQLWSVKKVKSIVTSARIYVFCVLYMYVRHAMGSSLALLKFMVAFSTTPPQGLRFSLNTSSRSIILSGKSMCTPQDPTEFSF